MQPILNSAVVAENTPLRLKTTEMTHPEMTLRNLYLDFHLNDMREVLWDVFSRSLIAKDEDLGHFSREDMLFYYEEMVKVLEAGSLLFGDYRPHVIEERALKRS
jgi:hypothetical protein